MKSARREAVAPDPDRRAHRRGQRPLPGNFHADPANPLHRRHGAPPRRAARDGGTAPSPRTPSRAMSGRWTRVGRAGDTPRSRQRPGQEDADPCQPTA